MAQRIESRVATCRAGVPQSGALEVDLSFEPGNVKRIDLLIPDGHAGATGIGVAQAHQVIIPATGDQWVVGNDQRTMWNVDDFLNTGDWSAFVYNNGDYPHSWYILFSVDEIVTPSVTPSVRALPTANILLGQSAA